MNLESSNTTSITEIDGSVLEGGGQILRLAASLSTLLKKPIKVKRIRANRAQNGLRLKHLKELEVVSQMCGGTFLGATIDAEEITYHPGDIKSGRFEMEADSAGSVALLMQVSVPIALFALSFTFLSLKGGTNTNNAPSIDHAINVFLPVLKKFGGEFDCAIDRRGYYPRGGGVVRVQISPVSTLGPVTMTQFGTVTHIWGRSFVAGKYPISVAHEMANAAVSVLSLVSPAGAIISINRVKESPNKAVGKAFGIVLFARTNTGCILGGSAVGIKRLSPYEVGKQAAEELAESLRGQYCIDRYTQDQIIILMALARGKSAVKCGPLTEHTKAAIHITEILTGAKFKVEQTSNFCLLECEGIGFRYT